MTNKELKEEITRLKTALAELEEKVEALPNRVGGVFKPEDGQKYWSIMSGGDVVEEWWNDNLYDHDRYVIGNCFPNKQAAENAVRVLKLIQKARESQDGFAPDWEDSTQKKHHLYFDWTRGEVYVTNYRVLEMVPIFGYWEGESACNQFIKDNHDELLWFFKEYQR